MSRNRLQRRGSILVGVVVALVMLQLVVVAIVVTAGRDHALSSARADGTRAMYAAEAGANMALREVATATDQDGDGTVGSVAASTTGKIINSMGSPATRALVTSLGASRTITVTGTSGSASRKVQTTVTTRTGVPGFYIDDWDLASNPGSVNAVNYSTTPTFAGVTPQSYLANVTDRARWPGHQGTKFVSRWRGTLNVPGTGTYTFWTTSSDGVILYVNGTAIITNNTVHGATTNTGTVALSKGTASLELRFFENTGTSTCNLEWQGPGVTTRRAVAIDDVTCTPTQPLPPVAIAGAVTLANSASIDGYNSSNGPYNASLIVTGSTLVTTNSAAAGAVRLSAQARIAGGVATPPGSTPSTVVSTTGNATVSGSLITNASRFAIPEYTIQGNQAATSGTVTLAANASATLTANTRWTSYTMNSGSSLTISGDITVWIDNNLSLASNASIIVPPNSRLTLIVGGNIALSGAGAAINSSLVSSRCRIYMTALSGTGKSFTNSGGTATIAADLYAPWCSVSLGVSSVFCGTVRANSLALAQSCKLHADLARTGQLSTSAGGVSVSSWSQIAP